MIKALSAALLLLFFAATTVGAQKKYIASYAGFAGFQAPLWAAKDFGFMNKSAGALDATLLAPPSKCFSSAPRKPNSTPTFRDTSTNA